MCFSRLGYIKRLDMVRDCMKINKTNTYGLKFIIFLFVVLFFICSATAHQPRVELGINTTASHPIIIENPGLMQAFYGNLNGMLIIIRLLRMYPLNYVWALQYLQVRV